MLALTGCGAETASSIPSGSISLQAVSEANEDQTCESLFGPAGDLGKFYSEADYTWEGESAPVSHRLFCDVTAVGTDVNDAPLGFAVLYPDGMDHPEIHTKSGAGAMPDKLKQKTTELVDRALTRITR